MPVIAVEHVRPMRGGAQAQLMRADDGCFYVVKFCNNPQHRRVLANEWLAAGIAQALGLPVPPVAQITVPADLVKHSPGLRFRVAGVVSRCSSGVQFGSRIASDDPYAPIYDYLPEAALVNVENLAESAGILLFDKWTCNCDARQLVFCRTAQSRKLCAYMVDNGGCFNTGDWNFPDSPLLGVYHHTRVYAGITGWKSFEPWLERLEHFDEGLLYTIARSIPPAWYGAWGDMERLIERIIRRRSRVRELVWAVKHSPRMPFENWDENRATAARAANAA